MYSTDYLEIVLRFKYLVLHIRKRCILLKNMVLGVFTQILSASQRDIESRSIERTRCWSRCMQIGCYGNRSNGNDRIDLRNVDMELLGRRRRSTSEYKGL